MRRRLLTTAACTALLIGAGVALHDPDAGVTVDPSTEGVSVAVVGGPVAAELAPAVTAALGGVAATPYTDAGAGNAIVAPVTDDTGRVYLAETWDQLGSVADMDVAVLTADWVRPQLACVEWSGCTDTDGAAAFARAWATEAASYWTSLGVDVVWVGWVPYDTAPDAPGRSWPSTLVNQWFAEGARAATGPGDVTVVEPALVLGDPDGNLRWWEPSDNGWVQLRSATGGLCPAGATSLADLVAEAAVPGWPEVAPHGWADPSGWLLMPADHPDGPWDPSCGDPVDSPTMPAPPTPHVPDPAPPRERPTKPSATED